MKTIPRAWAVAVAAIGLCATPTYANKLTDGFQKGAPDLKSATQLAFGPDGILFVADSKSAAVVAIATGDNKAKPAEAIHVENLQQKVAALLGTAAEQITISDIAVNPISHQAYLAVSRGRGPEAKPAIVRVDASNQLQLVSLDALSYSRAELPKAPIDQEPAAGSRRSNPRMESITDIAYDDGRVLVAGLSNEEFSSSFRAIPFPFDETSYEPTSVEIFHGAHGKFETGAPIRTFVPMKVGDETQLLAAYTCTPLVQIPIKAIEPKAKVRGKTVAELGNRNRPIDMIVYKKGGENYLLMANSSRGVMKIPTAKLQEAESITEPVRQEKAGVEYETVNGWTGVEQLTALDAERCLLLRKTDSGHNLVSMTLP